MLDLGFPVYYRLVNSRDVLVLNETNVLSLVIDLHVAWPVSYLNATAYVIGAYPHMFIAFLSPKGRDSRCGGDYFK